MSASDTRVRARDVQNSLAISKMASGHQLTLFQCVDSQKSGAKRVKIAQDDDRSSSGGDYGPILPHETDEVSSESDSEDQDLCVQGETLRHSLPGNQTNNITVKNPSGPTTLVINSSPSNSTSSTSSVQSACPKVPDDIASTPAFPPAQPVNIKYPATVISGKARSFNLAWYNVYPWLEYSIRTDACYCYSCHLFGSGSGSKCEQSFTLVGFKDWKHATGKGGVLSKHDSSCAHRKSVLSWNQYKINSHRKTSLSDRFGISRAGQVTQNRHYIRTLGEIILSCSHQEIALRGHREGEDSMNRGNFLEILNLVAIHDPVINERLKNGPRNAKYTSPDIQNTLINVMARTVQESICSSVRKAGAYTILADETKDCSKVEQLAIVVRYVDVEAVKLFEHFLTYVEATALDASSLSAFILDALRKNQLDPECIVSQGYDGASVMSGRCAGVQQKICEVVPHAAYVHCYAHCLNLVLVDSTKSVSEASDFFSLMETLYTFLSRSVTHAVFLRKQSELQPDKPQRQLQRLSDTRWSCRYLAVDAVCSTFDSVLATLEEIANGEDRSRATEATGIWTQVQTFKFLVSLIMFWRILSCTKSLSDQLQSREMDLAKAADLVLATVSTLKEFRSDNQWNHIYKYVQDIATLHGINVDLPRPCRRKQTSRRLQDVIVLESTGVRGDVSPSLSEHFRTTLYLPVLDAMLSELERRFTDKNLMHMRAVQACAPQSPHFLESNQLAPLADSYGLNRSTLDMEYTLAKHTLNGKELDEIIDVLRELSPLRAAFPLLVKLIQIALTIAVSTAHCERSFSALKRIKSYLRSTMTQQRLVDLAILSIERELSQSLSLDNVVNQFASQDKNRRIILM